MLLGSLREPLVSAAGRIFVLILDAAKPMLSRRLAQGGARHAAKEADGSAAIMDRGRRSGS